jgi:hypothetical protein
MWQVSLSTGRSLETRKNRKPIPGQQKTQDNRLAFLT